METSVIMTSMQKVDEGAMSGPRSHGNVMKGLWAEECNGEEEQWKGRRKEGSEGRGGGGKARPFVSSIDKKKRVGGRG